MVSEKKTRLKLFLLTVTAFTVALFGPWIRRIPQAFAQTAGTCAADINQDLRVDLSDYSILVSNFLKNPFPNPRADIDGNGRVDLSDYSILVTNFLKTCVLPSNTPTNTPALTLTPTAVPSSAPSPTPISQPISDEWTQFGHDAQRTNYAATEIATPWKYKWQWNGAGADGKKQASHLAVPKNVQPITGGSRVYMIAANTVFALNKATGQVIWSRGSIGTLDATPAYYNENLFVPSGDGHIYKIDASTGIVSSNFTGSGAFNYAVLLVGDKLYAGTASGNLYSINTTSMTSNWTYYSGGSAIVAPPSYSQSKNMIIANSQDLYVHAVNASSGTRVWRVKPTARVYEPGNLDSNGAQFENGWPVIADQHGIVFVRYRLDWNTLWTWNPFPTTNDAIRSNLVGQPNVQALYALNLDNGQVQFVPAVGNGGSGDGGTLPMGTQPIVRSIGGQEVAYVIFRNGLTCVAGWCDGREDATMGEMTLDSTTVSGYAAGDMRFIRFTDIQTDEMLNITMSGNILFHSHWLINSAEKITDRSAGLGSTFTNPIKTIEAPFVIWRQVYCPPTNTQCNPVLYPGGSGTSYGPSNCPFNATTRYCSAGLYSYGDQRSYPPGFYEYHNDTNDGSIGFTVVSDGLVLVKTRDGGLMALENGNPTADVNKLNPVAQKVPKSKSVVLGATTPQHIDFSQASQHVGENVAATGRIKSVVDHLPKAMYLGFKNPHDGALLIRVFEKDISKFPYDLNTLLNKDVTVTGFVTLYWPDGVDPEIVVTDPSQIQILH